MAMILTYTSKVRQALKTPASVGVDLILLAGIGGILAALTSMARYMSAPREQAVVINLAFSALPIYASYSLARAFAAYTLSLVFTLVFGHIASHNRRAEKIMLPVLDVLQSLPVLALMPVVVITMVRIFPTRWFGLEIACVVTIFTAQAWNMAFSYHGSVRGIPHALREAAAIQRLTNWQIFKYLELPASMIGLVWNSMMSFAGGWFIITVNEALQLGNNNYELPGIGSYMSEALKQWNFPAMFAGVFAMVVMIVALDQFFWRPIVVWSQRFKLEDTAAADAPQSWVLEMFKHSFALEWIRKAIQAWRHGKAQSAPPPPPPPPPVPEIAPPPPTAPGFLHRIRLFFNWLILTIVFASSGWGALLLIHLLLKLPIHDTPDTNGWLAVLWALFLSFTRVMGALFVGAAWTIPFGVMIGLSPRWSNRLQPIIQIVASFPSPMIFPLVTLLFLAFRIPFGLVSVVLICLGTQWYTLFNVIAGAMAIPSELREASSVYRMSHWQRWTRLYLPAIFPYLLVGLITAAGGAWNATIVAELTYVPHRDNTTTTYSTFGLGYLITQASGAGTASANFPLLAASAVTLATFVVLFNRSVWKRIYNLAEERFSLNT
ncbi:MAG: ABC transporter permease subunit [Tepidisphaeraceae bacterium]